MNLFAGYSVILTAGNVPNGASIRWSMSPGTPPAITIDPVAGTNRCIVFGLAPGDATVTVTVQSPGFPPHSTDISITVLGNAFVVSIAADTSTTVNAGDSVTLTATVQPPDWPIDENDPQLVPVVPTWSTNQPDKCELQVSADGLTCVVVTTAICSSIGVIATVENGQLIFNSNQIDITSNDPITSFSISPSSPPNLDVGVWGILTLSVQGSLGNNVPQWSVSQGSPAAVAIYPRSNGTRCTVDGLAAGNATITASVPGHSSSVTVTVVSWNGQAYTVSVSTTDATTGLAADSVVHLTASISPSPGALVPTWSVVDSGAATLSPSSDGLSCLVTISNPAAIITVTCTLTDGQNNFIGDIVLSCSDPAGTGPTITAGQPTPVVDPMPLGFSGTGGAGVPSNITISVNQSTTIYYGGPSGGTVFWNPNPGMPAAFGAAPSTDLQSCVITGERVGTGTVSVSNNGNTFQVWNITVTA